MNNHYLSSLVDELIRNAYNSGKLVHIQDIYKASNWKITKDGVNYFLPSIFDIESKIRTLVDTMAEAGTDYEESCGIYVKLDYTPDERSILIFGFNYKADEVYEKSSTNVKIVDQNGNNLEILKVSSDGNLTTYEVKVIDNFTLKFNKSKLMDNYKQEFKKRMYGNEND
jgi:hypothetical protein